MVRAKPTSPNILRTRYTYTWIVVVICALMQFFIPFLRNGDKIVLNDVFGGDKLDTRCTDF